MAKRKSLGSVDLLGLNAFGQNPGLSPIYGALIGGGTSNLVALLAGKFGSGSIAANRTLVGFGAGLAVSGGMYAMPATRHAALGSLVGAFLATGLRWLEGALFGSSNLGIAQISQLRGLGIAQMSQVSRPAGLGIAQINQLNGGGLGMPAMNNMPRPIGVAGPQLGAPQLQGSATLMGGPPTMNNMAARYGATLLGGGRH
jgi:hypothetical protein